MCPTFEQIEVAIQTAIANYEVDRYLDITGKMPQEVPICAVTITPEQQTEIINSCNAANAANKHLRWIDWVLVEGVNGSIEFPVMLICCNTTGSANAYVLHEDGCFIDGELQ
jgi:hypothetical protein